MALLSVPRMTWPLTVPKLAFASRYGVVLPPPLAQALEEKPVGRFEDSAAVLSPPPPVIVARKL